MDELTQLKEIVSKTLEVLRENLPPDGVSDKDTISRLWEIYDDPANHGVLGVTGDEQ